MVHITLCRRLVGAENGRWEEAVMHLMVQHHCSSTDLAFMLFLVGSSQFSLLSTCPPQASEKILGLGRCFCCICKVKRSFLEEWWDSFLNPNCMFQWSKQGLKTFKLMLMICLPSPSLCPQTSYLPNLCYWVWLLGICWLSYFTLMVLSFVVPLTLLSHELSMHM